MRNLLSFHASIRRHQQHISTLFLTLIVGSFFGYGSYLQTPFAHAATNIDISGVIWNEDPMEFPCASDHALTVRVKVNGAGSYSGTCSADDGTYTVSAVSVNPGDTITMFVDDASLHAAYVTKAPAVPVNINKDLNQNLIELNHEDGGTMTNADFDLYDSAQNGNIDWTVTSNNLVMLNASSINQLGGVYTPGGTVSGNALTAVTGATVTLGVAGNALTTIVANGGTVNINSDTTLAGTCVQNFSGTITYSSGTPTVTCSSIGTISMPNSYTFYNLTFTGGPKIFSSNGSTVTINNSFSIGNGVSVDQRANLVVSGSLTTSGTGSISYSAGTPNTTVQGATIGGGTGNIIFYNLTKSATGTTTWTGSGSNIVRNQLTVSAGTFVPPSQLLVQSIDDTGGTISASSGTIFLQKKTSQTVTVHSTLNNLVLNDGLVGYYKLDESSAGTAADQSGFGNTGTASGSPTVDASVPTTQFTNAKSLSFNGTSQYVDLGNPAILNSEFGDTISMSAWIKSATLVGLRNIVGKSYTSPHADPYYSWNLLQAGAVLSCRLDSTVVQSSGSGAGALTTGTWMHVACVYNGATVKIYINGVEVGSAARTGAVTTSTRNVRIGGRDTSDPAEYFSGNIDDVRIYNRPLGASEVQMLAEGQGWGFSGATYTLGSALNVAGDLTIPSGTLAVGGSNYGISVGGSLQVLGGVISAGTGTVTLNGTSSGKTFDPGRQLFHNITVNGSGGEWTLADRLEAMGALAIQAGTLDVSTSNYAVRAATLNQTGGTFTSRSGMLSLMSTSNVATAISSPLNTVRVEDPSEQSLAGYWKFDMGSGTSLRDYSGNSLTGTLTNGYTWTSSVNSTTTYDNPRAIDFDGTNDYVDIGNNINVNSSGDLTISGWFNRDTANTDDVLVAKRNGNAAGDIGYIIWIDAATDKLRMEMSDGTNEYELASSATFTTTGWHHFVATWDESLVAGTKLYVDGALDAATATGTLSNVGSLSNAVALRIGAESDDGAPFDGKIDDMRIYTTPLTATQAADLGAGRYANGDQGTATFTLSGTGTVATLSIDSGVLNGGTSGLTVTNAFSLLDGQGAYVGGSGTQTFSSTMSIAASTLTLGGTIVVNGNFTQTGGTVTGASGGTLSVGGNITLNAGATFTAGTSTVAMTGASKTIDSAGKTLYGFSVSGTDSPTANDLTITGPLSVADAGTLTLGSGRTLTHSGSSFTLNTTGTITGAGTLTFLPASSGPGTGGTISVITRFDASSGDIASTTADARTYSAKVELFASSSSDRTITLPSGTFTLSGSSSHLHIKADGAGDLTVDGSVNSPTVTVDGDIALNGSGAGVEAWVAGDNTWTATGNVDTAQGFYSPRMAVLNPTWDNYGFQQDDYSSDGFGGCDFNGTTYGAGTSSSTSMSQGIETGASSSCNPSGTDYFHRSYLKFNLSGIANTNTITRADLQIHASVAGSAFAIYRSNNDAPDGVAAGSLYSVGTGTGLSGSYSFGTGVNIVPMALGGTTNIQSSLGNAAYAIVLDGGSGVSTLTSVDSSTNKPKLRIGYYAPATTPTLIMNGTGTLSGGTQSGFYNLTMSGTNTFNTSHQANIYNTLALTGSITTNSAPVVMTGANSTIIGGNNTLGNLTVADGTTTLTTSNLTTSLNVQLLGSGILSIASGRTLTALGNVLLNSGTTITGSGTLVMTSASSGPGTAGTLSSRVRYDATSGNITSTTFDARTYGGVVEIFSSSGVARTATLAASTYTLSGTTSDLILIADGTANVTLDAQTNNATVSIGGGIDFQGVGAGTERITPGSNSWTVGGNIDFTNGVFLPPTNNTLVLSGTGSSVTFAGQNPYNLTAQSGSSTTITDAVVPAHTLNVASSSTLTLGASSVMTLSSPVTLQGTIDGPGMMWLDPSATIGTSGTISTNVTFDATGGSLSVPTRTFSGSTRTVTLLNDAAPTTLGTGAGTISIAGNLILDDGGAEATYDGTAYNPTVSIGGNITLGIYAIPDLFMGSGIWTVGGNIDLANASVISATSASLILTGTGKTLALTNDPIGYIRVQGSTTATTAFRAGQELRIDSGATLTASNSTTTLSGDFINSGTFQGGSGTVLFNASSTGHVVQCGTGTLNNLTFNNASGGWTVQTSNCSVGGALNITAATSWTLESGRTMTVSGAFTNSVGGSATTWTGSTLTLQGSGSNTVNTKAVNEIYATVNIGASREVAMWNSTIGSLSITTGGGLRSYDDQQTDGRLYLAGVVHIPDGEYWAYAYDFDGVALGTSRVANVVVEPSSAITVSAGNDLTLSGEQFAAHRTVVDRNGSTGTFSFDIQGGLSAEFFELHHLSSAGLNIASTATISKLEYGIFDDGVAGGSYITLNSPTSTLTTTELTFDATSNGTDSATPKAITATGSGVIWTMNGAAGNRTGNSATTTASGASITWNLPTLSVLDGLSADLDLSSGTDHLDLSWTATSTQYVASFALGIGTTLGGYEVSALSDVGSLLSTTLNSLNLVDGQTYYATVVARNGISEPLFVGTSDGIRVDVSAPEISDLVITAEESSADVAWTTNESATTLIEWGTTTDLGTTAVSSSAFTTSHSGTISGLSANGTYYARVSSTDEIGNTVQSEVISFTTTEVTETAAVGTPTLYPPVYRRTGSQVTLMVTGITRNSSAVRLYVDNKLYSAYIIKSTSTVTSFAIALPLKNLKNGSHSYYVQSVGQDGEVGGKSRTVKFTVSGTTSAKRSRVSEITTYVVQRGDSLWSIARRFLGSGANYKQLISQNSSSFRSLLKNSARLSIGWIIRIPGF